MIFYLVKLKMNVDLSFVSLLHHNFANFPRKVGYGILGLFTNDIGVVVSTVLLCF